jgi:hypothetical protein
VTLGNTDGEIAGLTITQTESRREAKESAEAVQRELWAIAVKASKIEPSPATTGLFAQSLNELIDSYGRRDAALNKQVPEIVILLLFAVFIVTAAVLGYAAGLGGSRAGFATMALSLLVVLVVLIVIDLDRPRRGFIQVDQNNLLELVPPQAR